MKMKEKLTRFMQGRYGTDKLNTSMLILAVFCSLLGSLFRWNLLILVSYGILGYTFFRILSRNRYKRYKENQKFLKQYNKFIWWFQKKKRRMEESKTHCFYKCSKCKQTVRVPRGKGRIEITCPKCRNEFVKKT